MYVYYIPYNYNKYEETHINRNSNLSESLAFSTRTNILGSANACELMMGDAYTVFVSVYTYNVIYTFMTIFLVLRSRFSVGIRAASRARHVKCVFK